MAAKGVPRRRRRKYARCGICHAWRPIAEMVSDTDICHADDPSETPVFRFWECPTHTKKQDDRLVARLRERFPEMKL